MTKIDDLHVAARQAHGLAGLTHVAIVTRGGYQAIGVQAPYAS